MIITLEGLIIFVIVFCILCVVLLIVKGVKDKHKDDETIKNLFTNNNKE